MASDLTLDEMPQIGEVRVIMSGARPRRSDGENTITIR
jgi:hypothetical protein